MTQRENERLRKQIAYLAPFLAIWADAYQRDHGLDGLHPIHYDMLAETGTRMVGFKRATNAPTPSIGELKD
jgi:hypothetical protein